MYKKAKLFCVAVILSSYLFAAEKFVKKITEVSSLKVTTSGDGNKGDVQDSLHRQNLERQRLIEEYEKRRAEGRKLLEKDNDEE